MCFLLFYFSDFFSFLLLLLLLLLLLFCFVLFSFIFEKNDIVRNKSERIDPIVLQK